MWIADNAGDARVLVCRISARAVWGAWDGRKQRCRCLCLRGDRAEAFGRRGEGENFTGSGCESTAKKQKMKNASSGRSV